MDKQKPACDFEESGIVPDHCHARELMGGRGGKREDVMEVQRVGEKVVRIIHGGSSFVCNECDKHK